MSTWQGRQMRSSCTLPSCRVCRLTIQFTAAQNRHVVTKRCLLDAGIELVTKAMETWQHHEGVQCNCCLAIMALVRGTGSVCQVCHTTEPHSVHCVVQS